MVTVRLPGVLARYAGDRDTVRVEASTVEQALRKVSSQHPDLDERLFDVRGLLRSHLLVALGDRELEPGTLGDTQVSPGDEIVVLLALAGG